MNADWWDRFERSGRRIRRAWIFAVIGSTISLVTALTDAYGYGGTLTWVSAILGYALAFGVYRRSTFACAALLALHIGGRVYNWQHGEGRAGLLIGAVLFGYVYVQGLRGAIEQHQLESTRDATSTAGEPVVGADAPRRSN